MYEILYGRSWSDSYNTWKENEENKADFTYLKQKKLIKSIDIFEDWLCREGRLLNKLFGLWEKKA